MDRTRAFFSQHRRSPEPGTDGMPAAGSGARGRGDDDAAHAPLDAADVAAALAQVRSLGDEIGLRLEAHHDGELLRATLSLPAGRQQQVFVRVSGRLARGLHVLTLFSPAPRLPHGSEHPPTLLHELLLVNERQRFVRTALWPMDDGTLVVASWDQILETMEAEELGTQIRALAVVADHLEQVLGEGDRF